MDFVIWRHSNTLIFHYNLWSNIYCAFVACRWKTEVNNKEYARELAFLCTFLLCSAKKDEDEVPSPLNTFHNIKCSFFFLFIYLQWKLKILKMIFRFQSNFDPVSDWLSNYQVEDVNKVKDIELNRYQSAEMFKLCRQSYP